MKKLLFVFLANLCGMQPLGARTFVSAAIDNGKPAMESVREKQEKPSWAVRMGARLMAKRLKRLAKNGEMPTRKCAVILKRDGTEIFAHILTRNREKVTYKPCGQPKGRSIVLATDSIQAVKMPDDLLWEPVPGKNYVAGKNKAGNASLVFGILAWVTAGIGIGFLFAIAGLVTGIISVRRKYRRQGGAIVGIVLSGLLLLMILVAVLFLLLYWGI